MITPFQNLSANDTAPTNNYATVTPSDTIELPQPTRGVYVGGAGNIALVGQPGSTAVTFVGVAAGTILPIRASRVMSTNTTASNIVALY